MTAFNKMQFYFKKNSPEIMLIGGVVGVVAATVLACRATLKANDILNETSDMLEDLRNDAEAESEESTEVAVVDKKELTSVYLSTAKDLAIAYGPAVVLGTASIAMLLSSNKQYKSRMAALAAAYTTVDTAFKNYRKNVVESLGEDKDNEFMYGLKKQKVDVITEDKDGNETTKKQEVMALNNDIGEYSQYARFFDESCPDWTKSADQNKLFLELMEQLANEKLQRNGYLFLNDVYESLGIPKSPAGQIVGWLYDKEKGYDNRVSFKIFENAFRERNRAFINGYEPVILLDFNVDGVIYDQI